PVLGSLHVREPRRHPRHREAAGARRPGRRRRSRRRDACRRRHRAPAHPGLGVGRRHPRGGDRRARLAAEPGRLQQRRDRLRGAGRVDRRQRHAAEVLPDQPRPPAAVPDDPLGRLPRHDERLRRPAAVGRVRRRDRLRHVPVGPVALRPARGSDRRRAARRHAVPRRREPPGAARRPDGLLLDADAVPAGEVRGDAAFGVAVRDGRGAGPDVPVEGDRLRLHCRGLRVPRARAEAEGTDPRPRRLRCRARARHAAVPGVAVLREVVEDGQELLRLAAAPPAEPRRVLLPLDGPGRARLHRARRRDRGPAHHAARAQLARDVAALVDPRAGRLLRALAGEGLPVPAADRAGGRDPPRARVRAAPRRSAPALRPDLDPRSGGDRGRRHRGRAQPRPPDRAADHAVEVGHLPRRVRWCGRRSRGRSVGRHEPAAPQPRLRGAVEPRPPDPPRRPAVPRVGLVLREPLAALRRQAAPVRREVPRPRRAHRERRRHLERSEDEQARHRDLRGAAVTGALRRWVLAVAGAVVVCCLAVSPVSASTTHTRGAVPGTPTATPIKHLVSVMQENHTFDNYFGTYPGADGIPANACMPVDPTDKASKDCVKPFRIGKRPIQDLGSNHDAFLSAFDNGAMNGFVKAQSTQGVPIDLAMGHYDDRDIPYYWNVADQYVLFDKFFTSTGGGSVWNHMFWVAGTPGDTTRETVPEKGYAPTIQTIFDRLEAKGVSWKFYVQNYDPKINYKATTQTAHGAQVARVPLLAMARFVDDPKLASHIV